MAFSERLEIVELNAANEAVSLLNLNDGVHYMMEAGTFEPLPPEPTAVLSEDQRRWGGARQVGEVHTPNGSIEWVAGVTATTEQQALEKVEMLLAQLAANPFHTFVLWEVPGASHPTLYEMRGTGTWQPKYNVATFEGAQLFLFQVHLPVAPLAQGPPVKVYEKAGLMLPATLSLSTIPGDAPAKAEVTIATGEPVEPAFIGFSQGVIAVAANGEHIYWTNSKTGYIGRATVSGSSVEHLWLDVGGKPYGLAINSTHIFWGNAESNDIGRATLAGGSVEGSFITGCSFPLAIAVNSEYIYWSNAGTTHIGRATLAGGVVEQSFMGISLAAQALAVDGTYIYWARVGAIARALKDGTSLDQSFIVTETESVVGVAVSSERIWWANGELGTIGGAALNGSEINETWAAGVPDEMGQLVQSGLHIYWASGEFGTTVGRAASSPAPPIWALLGWGAPTTGLAPAPFGVLKSSAATRILGWTYQGVTDASEGKALYGYNSQNRAYWEVDPAAMVPDSFSGEVGVEVYARVLVSPAVALPLMTVSSQPADGPGYGQPRYTDEWGAAGRPLQVGEGEEKWRMTRLGTLHMLVNPLAPRIWRLVVEGEQDERGPGHYWGLDYLLLVPVTQRACSPSGKLYSPSFPPFIATVGEAVKTVHSDLSAVLSKPGNNGFPDSGLGGQLLELPPGEGVGLVVKLSSMVPDAPGTSPVSEDIGFEATVTVWVTPRFFLARTQ